MTLWEHSLASCLALGEAFPEAIPAIPTGTSFPAPSLLGPRFSDGSLIPKTGWGPPVPQCSVAGGPGQAKVRGVSCGQLFPPQVPGLSDGLGMARLGLYCCTVSPGSLRPSPPLLTGSKTCTYPRRRRRELFFLAPPSGVLKWEASKPTALVG